MKWQLVAVATMGAAQVACAGGALAQGVMKVTCNNQTGDVQAINTALAPMTAPSQANPLTVSVHGTCYVDGTIKLLDSWEVLKGTGIGNTILTVPVSLANQFPMIEIGQASTKPSAWVSNDAVTNMSLNGNEMKTAPLMDTNGDAIKIFGGVTSSRVANLDIGFDTDAVHIFGSGASGSGLNVHDMRHEGWYVAGDQNFPSPQNIATTDTLTQSTFTNNTLDNMPGKTWDVVDYDVAHQYGSVTSITITGNSDILFADPTAGRSGNDNADNNSVNNNTTGGLDLGGIRFYGQLTNEEASGNKVENTTCIGTGINVVAG